MALRKREEKSWGYSDSVWHKVGGGASNGTYDVDNSKPLPDENELIRAEEGATAACVRVISHTEASIEPRLFTNAEEMTRSLTLKKVSDFDRKHLQKHMKVSPLVRKSKKHLDEIVDHELLDLINCPNPYHSWQDLVNIVARCREITGNAFLHIVWDKDDFGNPVGLPHSLYPLPPQNVALVRDDKNRVVGYRLGTGEDDVPLSLEEVIHFKADADLGDMYGRGKSPMLNVWQKIQIGRRDSSYWESLLANMGRPDIVLAPTDKDAIFPKDIKERIIRDYVAAFRGGNAGYPLFLDGAVSVTPLTYAPKDMASFELIKAVKTEISNGYGVPMTVWETPDSTSASASAGMVFFVEYTIKPKVTSFYAKLNKELTPYFGENLFLAPADYSPRDRNFELQEDTAGFDRQCLTVNEWREKRGLSPRPDGDRMGNPGGTPAGQISLALDTTDALVTKDTEEAVEETPVPDTDQGEAPLVTALKALFKRQEEATVDALKDFTFKGLTSRPVLTQEEKELPSYLWKSKPDDLLDLSHWDEEFSLELNPIIEAIANAAAGDTVKALGLSPSIGRVTQPKVKEAAQALTLDFCKATNDTTSLLLSDALATLRQEIGTGVDQGELRRQITERVRGVFQDASLYRADRIAATEQLRTLNTASMTVAKESGVVKGKKWLPATNACDVCLGIAQKGVIPLDAKFATIGQGPYADVVNPPAHPGCRCSLTYELS